MKKIFILIMALSILTSCSLEINNNSNDIENSNLIEENKDITERIETVEEIKKREIKNKIENMTVEEKVGQLFMLCFRKDENGKNIISINENIINILNSYKPSGVIIFGENLETKQQTKDFILDLQKNSDIPLFIGIDEEGGRVSRLSNLIDLTNYNIPSAQTVGKSNDEQYAYDIANTIAVNLKDLGFNLNFAPVADINTNSNNAVIGDRAYGSDKDVVSKMALKFKEAMDNNNISCSAKHFPGHGDTYTDTHKEETIVNHTIERLEETEFVPFKVLIDNNIDFIMVSHIKTPNATNDNLPSSISQETITDILREKLDFNKIVITDAMDMGAITNYYGVAQSSVMAIKAGVDIILMPYDIDIAYKAVLDAVKNNEISIERLNKSVERILSVKYDREIFLK